MATNNIYLPPRELGLKSVTVPASSTFTGRVIPWRIAHSFQTIIIHVWFDSGTPNFVPRVRYYDFNKVLRGTSGREFQNPAALVQPVVWFVTDETVRSSAGNPSPTGIPIAFGAPYVDWQISNSAGTSIVASMEIMLLDGV